MCLTTVPPVSSHIPCLCVFLCLSIRHGQGRPSSNGSTPRDSSLTYLYREKGGMTGTIQYSRPDSRDAASSERTRERQGLREAWKEEEREKETESDQSEIEKMPLLSYLMEVLTGLCV